jgi:hypothetical protein
MVWHFRASLFQQLNYYVITWGAYVQFRGKFSICEGTIDAEKLVDLTKAGKCCTQNTNPLLSINPPFFHNDSLMITLLGSRISVSDLAGLNS